MNTELCFMLSDAEHLLLSFKGLWRWNNTLGLTSVLDIINRLRHRERY